MFGKAMRHNVNKTSLKDTINSVYDTSKWIPST